MRKFTKAYTAAGVAAVATLGAACTDGKVTVAELVVALGAGLVAGAATYQVKNKG